MSQFQDDIKKFNGIYKLPVSSTPTLEVGVPVEERLTAFKNILAEELDEIDEIIQMTRAETVSKLAILTSLADLLGDIQVYCASEMAKFGLPLDETLEIIMQSNFSKLDAYGNPIYDQRGKVMKGPNYWKPEPKISEMLEKKFETNSIKDVYNEQKDWASVIQQKLEEAGFPGTIFYEQTVDNQTFQPVIVLRYDDGNGNVRNLRSRWTLEVAQDAYDNHGIDIKAELITALFNEIVEELKNGL